MLYDVLLMLIQIPMWKFPIKILPCPILAWSKKEHSVGQLIVLLDTILV